MNSEGLPTSQCDIAEAQVAEPPAMATGWLTNLCRTLPCVAEGFHRVDESRLVSYFDLKAHFVVSTWMNSPSPRGQLLSIQVPNAGGKVGSSLPFLDAKMAPHFLFCLLPRRPPRLEREHNIEQNSTHLECHCPIQLSPFRRKSHFQSH
jgi:hypothetical protein